MRKFSVPFNGIASAEYLSSIEKYSKYIDNIFTGVSFIGNNHHNVRHFSPDGSEIDLYENNVRQFLIDSLGKYKRIVTLNSGFYDMNCSELTNWLESVLFPFIEAYKIDGCICTDFIMAKSLHQVFPNLEIHTSCNCFQWNIRQMELWKEECGVSVFNPPREILRSPQKLKEMHDAGFKIKALINESCLYGCPQSINHCMATACGKDTFGICNRGDLTNFFRGNWVLPRWLDKLDEYVDIYKISGRMYPIDFLLRVLDAYVNRKEVDNLPSILTGYNATAMLEAGLKIPSSIVHDKLLTCECKECDKTCFACRILMAKLLMGNNIQ